VVFDDNNNNENNIEVIEWDFSNLDKNRIRTSKKRFWNKFFPDWSGSIDLLEQIINYLKFIFHLLIAESIQFVIY